MKKSLAKGNRQKHLYEKMGIDPFVLVVFLVLSFIVSIIVFPNLSLYEKLAGNPHPTLAPKIGAGSQANSAPVLQAASPKAVEEKAANDLGFACVADLQKHAFSSGSASSLEHCLSEYEAEGRNKPKSYGEECVSHGECPPSLEWTEDAHHGECPAGARFKCSVRCTSDGDCLFKTGGVLAKCCRECASGQPFGFCVN